MLVALNKHGEARCNRVGELERLPRGKTMDFLETCVTDRELKILELWEKHFREKDVAYAVVVKNGGLTIVKERKS